MQNLTSYIASDGTKYHIPADKEAEFKADFGEDAQPAVRYRTKDGQGYTIPTSEIENFRVDFPDAEPTRRMSFADGSTRDFTMPELSKFLRSPEWREGEQFKADRDERDKIVASRPVPNPKSESTFLADYADGLADAGGTAIGRTLGGSLSRFAKFIGTVTELDPRTMAKDYAHRAIKGTLSKDDFTAGAVADRMLNNGGMFIGNQIDKATDILFPAEQKTDSAVAQGVGKAIGLGAGLAEFALTPTPILAGGHFVEGWQQTYEAAKARGATDEEAMQLGLMRGGTDAGITTAFKNAPVHRIMKAFGYAPKGAVQALIDKAGKDGIAGVARGDLATAVGKQMLANAIPSIIEMGGLGAAQEFIDSAITQEAQTGKIDWEKCATDALKTGGEQALFGAVMAMLPTPFKVREALKQRDAMLKTALEEPMGVLAYANANPEAANKLAEAWSKEGKISRRVAREAGLPEMDEASRNAVGETIVKSQDANAELAKNRIAAEKAEAEKQPTEIKDETGNVPDEKPAQPKPPVETRAEGAEAVRPVEGEPPRGEAPRPDVVKPAEEAAKPPKTREESQKYIENNVGKRFVTSQGIPVEIGGMTEDGKVRIKIFDESGTPDESDMLLSGVMSNIFGKGGWKEAPAKPPQSSQEPPLPPKTGKDTPRPAEGVEAASRASDAKPVPDGKGKMVKPKAAESDYGVTMFEEPAVDGDGVRYVVKDGPSDAHRMMFKSKAEAETRLAALRAERKAIKESPSATLADGTKVHLLKTDEGWVPYDEHYNDLRHGMFKAAKTKTEAVEVAEKGVKQAKDVAEFNSAYKRFGEDFGLDEFNKKVGWGNENGEGWDESAALEHLRRFDLEKLKDMKERAKRFNLGHHNGRDKKIQEWFDKVISEKKSPLPDGKGKMVKPEKPVSKLSGEQWTKEQYEERKNLIATGKPVSVAGFPKGEALAVKQGRNWIVIDGKSGLRFGVGRIRKDAIADAETNLKNHTKEQVRRAREMGSSYFNTARDAYEPKASNMTADAELRKDFDKTVKSALSQEGRPIDNLHDAAERLIDTIKDRYEGDANVEKALDKALADFKENNPLGRGIKPSHAAEYFKEFADELAKKYEIPGYDGKVEPPKYDGRKMKVGDVDRIQERLFELRGEYADTAVEDEGAFDPLPFREIDAKKLKPEDRKALTKLEADVENALSDIDYEGIEFEKSGVLADESRKLVDAYTEARDNLNRFLEQADRYQHLKRNKEGRPLFSRAPEGDLPDLSTEPPKSPEAEISERLDLKRLDPKRRSNPKVLAWAKKNGRNVTNGMVTPDAVRAYDEAMTENTGRLVKRWFPDMKIVAHKFGEKIKRGQHVLDLHDTSGHVLGWFDPKSKEVHLLPGADPKTVAHEIMWHGTRDYITQLAAKGDARAQKFLDMMHDVEQNAPQAIKDIVNRIYARGGKAISRDTLLNEYGAWATMGKGGAALEKALQKAENRNWFAKAVYTVKEMFKDFLTAHGRNRVDIAAIDGMTRDEFVDFIAKEFASGKTLGNIKGPQQPTVSTKETALQKYKRRVYDQNAAVRDLERDIEKKTGKKISADDSVEAANALKYGLKEAANIETQGKMREFRKVLGETGIHYEDFEYYAALKAAAGRDAKIDARNIAKLTDDMKAAGASAQDIADAVANYKSTNGSHIDPREARKMLAEIENGPDAAKFKKAYDAIRPIIDETLDIQVNAGLVDAKDAAQWRKEEPNYIPFKNEYDAETGEWQGRGTSRNFTKPEHYMAKGRQSAAGDILAHIFMDHQAAKLRAIENGVRQKLAALVKANPELGKVEILDKDAVRNAEKDNPNVVVFKQNGRAYKITLEGTRGEAIANAFTQRNQLKMEWADKKFMGVSLRGFTRLSAGLATRLSPTFAVRNTTKDNIELANIVYSERGPIEGTKWMAQYAKVRAATLKNVANVLTGHKLGIDGDTVGAALGKYITTGKIDTSSKGGKILDRYIKAGGLIAGGTRAEAFDSIKKSLSPEAIAKELKRGNSLPRAILKHTFSSIGYLNEYAEMATRVGIFATEVRSGKSDAEAALFSRRATVDFNRHGDWTPGFNLFRLFSNSTLGATARATVALGKSKYGIGFAAALFAKGVANALTDHFANAEEDERRRKTGEATGKDMSEYERRTSLWYYRDGDKVYKVAQHESPFSLLSYAGDCVGRWMCGDLDGKQVAKNLGISTAEVAYNFLPMGSANFTAQSGGFTEDVKAALVSAVCPTFLQPIAELAANIDYAGRTIYNEAFPGDNSPRSEHGRDSTPDWAKESATQLNEATRTEGHRKGYVDVPPEAIQKLVEGYGKNALRDVSMAVSVGEAIVKGDWSKFDPRNTPVKRDFVRPLDGNDRRFNAAMKEYKANKDTWKKESADMTEQERADYLKKFPHVKGDRVDNLLKAIQKFQKMEHGFWYRTGKATPHEWPQEKLDEFKAKRRELQAKVLEIMGK